MTTYLFAKGNLKHNGDFYEKGSVFESSDEFVRLVNDGVLDTCEEASIEDAISTFTANEYNDTIEEVTPRSLNLWSGTVKSVPGDWTAQDLSDNVDEV